MVQVEQLVINLKLHGRSLRTRSLRCARPVRAAIRLGIRRRLRVALTAASESLALPVMMIMLASRD